MKVDKLRLSYSSRKILWGCPRKLQFYKFFRLPKAFDDKLAPGAGKAIHAGFQAWLQTQDMEEAIYRMMLSYPTELNSNPNKDRSMEACYATLLQMINSVQLSEYQIATIMVPNDEGVLEEKPAIEVPFEISVANFSLSDEEEIPVTYIGYVDAYLFSVLSETYTTTDIKTHRNNMHDLTAEYKFSEQDIPYAMVLEKMLGRPVDNMEVKYISSYVDLLQPKVQVYEFTRTKEDVEEWCRNLLVDLQQLKYYYNTQWFPKRGNHCMNFRSRCDFFEVCAMKNEDAIQSYLTMGEEGEDPNKPTEDFKPWVKLTLDLGL